LAHNLQHIIEQKLGRLQSVPDALVSKTERVQGEVYKEVIKLVSQLEQKDSRFIFSQRNIALIEQINNRLQNLIFDTEYLDAITTFANEFNKQATINNSYFDAILENFEDKAIYQSVLRTTQKNALQLLSGDSFTQNLTVPLTQILEASVTSNVTFADTVKTLTEFIQGNKDMDGRMISHVKRVAYDAFSVSDAVYTNSIAEDYGLVWYKVQGGIIEDTRDFCKHRNGKYYHKNEILDWAELKWQGKNANTTKETIFIFRGGYRCLHGYLPVTIKSVPKNVIDRNIASKNYKSVN
jgi:hypothetical protein